VEEDGVTSSQGGGDGRGAAQDGGDVLEPSRIVEGLEYARLLRRFRPRMEPVVVVVVVRRRRRSAGSVVVLLLLLFPSLQRKVVVVSFVVVVVTVFRQAELGRVGVRCGSGEEGLAQGSERVVHDVDVRDVQEREARGVFAAQARDVFVTLPQSGVCLGVQERPGVEDPQHRGLFLFFLLLFRLRLLPRGGGKRGRDDGPVRRLLLGCVDVDAGIVEGVVDFREGGSALAREGGGGSRGRGSEVHEEFFVFVAARRAEARQGLRRPAERGPRLAVVPDEGRDAALAAPLRRGVEVVVADGRRHDEPTRIRRAELVRVVRRGEAPAVVVQDADAPQVREEQ